MDNKRKEKLKKGLVFGGLGLLFALSIWFIFKSSEKDKAEEQKGLNKDLPGASVEKLTDNKLKAYELGRNADKEEHAREEMGRLSDYFEANTQSPEADKADEGKNSTSKIENSLQRYEENNRLISSFYAPDPYEKEREELRAEINELRSELSKREDTEDKEEERQLALMEKSYQMAAKYLPQPSGNMPMNDATAKNNEKIPATPTNTGNLPTMEVVPERKPVVSSLHYPMSDGAFISEYGYKERNMGFHSVGEAGSEILRNTLRVVVDHTVTVKDGDYVVLRLSETAKVRDMRIPRQSRLMAQAKIEGNRMRLLIKSVEVEGRICAVHLSAYDTDGQEGVFIPGSENVSALKEVGANIGGSVGTSFTFSSSAKDQIISEAARGVMQGASQLLQKKLRTVKVTLKGGYRLFLLQTK